MTENPTAYDIIMSALQGNYFRPKNNPEAPLIKILGISDQDLSGHESSLECPYFDVEVQGPGENNNPRRFRISAARLHGLERVSQEDLDKSAQSSKTSEREKVLGRIATDELLDGQ